MPRPTFPSPTPASSNWSRPWSRASYLDLGCGPADIVLRFLKTYPGAECDALDGSAAMLEQARRALDA